MRTLVEFRGEVGELTLGESVTVESFEVGARVKVAGVSKGKGFQGTIKRHNFSQRPLSRTARTTCARPARSAPRRRPRGSSKGIRGPGQMGNKRATQKGLEVVRSTPSENLMLVRGSVPGPRGGIVEVRSDG